MFVELYRKTQQVKRQAEERVALAREQAARAAAEEATRRSAFLAEASTVLARSLDYEAIPRRAGRPGSVPFLADLCAVTLIGDDGSASSWRTELAWIDPARRLDTSASLSACVRERSRPLSEPHPAGDREREVARSSARWRRRRHPAADADVDRLRERPRHGLRRNRVLACP